jgi:phage-related protein
MRHFLVYDGKSSYDFNMIISGEDVFNKPSRVVRSTTIDGKNGSLTDDRGYFENAPITYKCGIKKEAGKSFDELASFIMSRGGGYHRLEDSYHPDCYRMARCNGAISTTRRGYIADDGQPRVIGFELDFDCMPQLYLKEGEYTQEFTSNGTLYNPTYFEAKPLIRVYGTGSLNIGNTTLTVTSNPSYIDLDCEREDAYYGAQNCSGYIQGHDYPTLKSGINNIAFTGFSKVEVTPRWWRI